MRTKYFFPLLLAGSGAAFIIPTASFAQDWTQTPAPIMNWSSIACSADGTKLVAAAGGAVVFMSSAPSGRIYTSADSGSTWTATTAPNIDWTSVASSADGTKLAALPYTGGGASPVYASADSGANW